MTKITMEISMSLDGYVAGPNATLEQPLGEGGDQLHEWVFGLKSFRERHGMDGGEDSADSRLVADYVERIGAYVMGRRMFSGGQGRWEDDPNADGWWGDDPPFHVPVFVLTHHPRETVIKEGGTTFTFVTDGLGSAVAQARAAAGEKDVGIAGGANVVQQCLGAGLLDELVIHVSPVLLGSGVRLFDGQSDAVISLDQAQVIPSERVAHLIYEAAR
jgi:dihydrofolate reductase